ncbi:DUF4233 domain-containing protein [Frondihabitans sp. 762G35]|uniref:DUF4233 domain-containing protein n=1 Tax=Frondihabitans sp. 762G35 TaxID=1446794 RepID=UPI0013DAB661|nr:DUF4233 domain-containing protein [Frondihabitans sp. 762G35]
MTDTPAGAPGGDSPDQVAAPAKTRRPRRERSLTESLLSIMLVLEAFVLFFVILNVAGARILPTGVAWGGGLALIALMLLTSGVVRYRWGVVLGCVLQVAIALTGLLVGLMWVVAALFIGLWIFCLYKGVTIDRRNAAYRAWLEQNPGASA